MGESPPPPPPPFPVHQNQPKTHTIPKETVVHLRNHCRTLEDASPTLLVILLLLNVSEEAVDISLCAFASSVTVSAAVDEWKSKRENTRKSRLLLQHQKHPQNFITALLHLEQPALCSKGSPTVYTNNPLCTFRMMALLATFDVHRFSLAMFLCSVRKSFRSPLTHTNRNKLVPRLQLQIESLCEYQ